MRIVLKGTHVIIPLRLRLLSETYILQGCPGIQQNSPAGRLPDLCLRGQKQTAVLRVVYSLHVVFISVFKVKFRGSKLAWQLFLKKLPKHQNAIYNKIKEQQ